MALRETQHATEVYGTGGDTLQVTQHATEVYGTGGETFQVTQHATEAYVEDGTPAAPPIACRCTTISMETLPTGSSQRFGGILDRNGNPFTPKAYLTAGTERANGFSFFQPASGIGNFGFGVSGAQRSMAWYGANATLSSVSRSSHRDDAAIHFFMHNTNIVGISSQSLIGNGHVDFSVTDDWTSAAMESMFAIGGTALLGAKIVTITEPSSTGSQVVSVSGLGGIPSAIIFGATPMAAAAPASQQDAQAMFGVAVPGGGQAVYVGGSNFGSDPWVCAQYFRDDECLAGLNSGITGVASRASLASAAADEFTLNWSQVSGSNLKYHALVLYGGRYQVGTFAMPTVLNDTIAISTPSTVRGCFMFAGRQRTTLSVAGASDAESFGACWGFFDSVNNRRSLSTSDKHAANNGNASDGHITDAVIHYGLQAVGLEGKLDVSAIDSTSFTMKTTDADVATLVAYLAIMDPLGSSMQVPAIIGG